jgi:taurine transport system substrate-binding protein
MNRPLTSLAAVLAASTLSLGLAACGGDSQAYASGLPETITIGYQLIPNGDLVVKHEKLLEKEFGKDVEIEWKQFASGGDVNQAIIGGSIDIGLAGSSPVSRGLSSGIKYQVPWVHDVIGTAEALVVRDGTGIKDLDDLEGKTIATPSASTAHFSLLAALDDADVDTSKVKIIDAEPDAILAAWKAKQIDAAYIWNPVLAELATDGAVLTDSSEQAEAGHTTYDLAVVSNEFAEKYPEAVQTWVDAQDQAVREIKDDPQAAAAAIAAELNITPAEAAEQLKGLIFLDAKAQAGADYLGGGVAENLHAAAAFNKQLGQIETVQPESAYKKAVVGRFAEAVK